MRFYLYRGAKPDGPMFVEEPFEKLRPWKLRGHRNVVPNVTGAVINPYRYEMPTSLIALTDDEIPVASKKMPAPFLFKGEENWLVKLCDSRDHGDVRYYDIVRFYANTGLPKYFIDYEGNLRNSRLEIILPFDKKPNH